jgi:dimethylglycine dehydrogenase
MSVDVGESDCYGNEPVYFDNRLVGVTTSGAYGHAVRDSLAFAYVDPVLASSTASFHIMMMGEMREARIIPQPAWDPSNTRITA